MEYEYAHGPEREAHIFSVKSFSHEISFVVSTDEGIFDEEQHVVTARAIVTVTLLERK